MHHTKIDDCCNKAPKSNNKRTSKMSKATRPPRQALMHVTRTSKSVSGGGACKPCEWRKGWKLISTRG
ncbi:hypothetical protein Pmani_036195 [Petrolisthes manimaculis]|uniref:Uncharacterized protein n=1 Tax=Petrolisthes manimaculis TaxID=1843537 RepID=A0AAE1NLH4_9EUCA|nr:hypothetical protein Pmani_036195 [Petrolisthes manimaculis]